MPLPDSAERDAAGRLRLGGCDVGELAEEYGTPLYVFCAATIRSRLRTYRAALRAWPAGGDVLYSAKAYLSAAMVRLLVEEDCGIDVVSATELAAALHAGMAAERIGFPGNNKDVGEVEAALAARVGHLVVDSDVELALLETPGPGSVDALLRVAPGVRPDTHEHISTGQLDSKFGFAVEGGAALAALRRLHRAPRARLRGLHMHIGSQIHDLRSHVAAIEVVAGLADDAREELRWTVEVLSVGGGLGIAHTDGEASTGAVQFMSIVTATVARCFGARRLPLPALHVEPGRSVVGPAGVAVYRVGARKEVPGVRTYVAVDGGMADNLRPKLYGARYQPVAIIERQGQEREVVSLAGRYCESTDILVHDCELPRLRAGDLVAVPAAGAYTVSMASNYNLALRPAEVFVEASRARLARRRETLADLLARDVESAGAPVGAGADTASAGHG